VLVDAHKQAQLGHLPPSSFQIAHHQLLRILVHHMVEIGLRVNLLGPMAVLDRIIEDAYCQWNHAAAFTWSRRYGKSSNLALTPTPPSTFYASDGQEQSMRFGFGAGSGPIPNSTSCLFTPPDDVNGPQLSYSLPKSSWPDPAKDSGTEGETEFFVHNHKLGCTYQLSHPNECAFLETTDLLTVIRAHEAQGTDYRLYRNNSVFHNTFHRSRPSLSFNPPGAILKPVLMPSCGSCDGLVGLDGICERCIFTGVDLDNILDDLNAAHPWDFYSPGPNRKRSHLVTMRTCASTDPVSFDSDVDYSITETSPDYGPYTTPATTDTYETGFQTANGNAYDGPLGKISQWECSCTPTDRLVCSIESVNHAKGSVRLLV